MISCWGMKSKEVADGKTREFDFLRPPISLSKFIKQMGITTITAWRWRRDGKLRTINICGRQYVRAEELAEFNRRAEAGEFERKPATPKRGQPNGRGARRGRSAGAPAAMAA